MRSFVTDHGRKQAAVEADCFAQMRALQTEPAAVGRMIGIAGNLDRSLARHRRADAAADAAIGAGGADRVHQAAAFSVLARQMRTRPPSILTGTVGVQPLSSPSASTLERSEESRVGNACVSPCRSRWARAH